MTSHPSHTTILDDLPAGKDALDFQPYIDTLADIIASPNTSTPLTIGVFGTWGSGKTSLMKLVQGELQKKGQPGSFYMAWFDAWKYEKETELWRALLLAVLTTLRGAIEVDQKAKEKKDSLQALDDLENSLYRSVEREEVGNLQVNWGKFGEGTAQAALQIGLSFVPGVSTLTEIVKELQGEGATASTSKLVEALKRERTKIRIEQVQFLDQFQEKFRKLVKQHIVDKKHRLVVFIDDLDRCLPEKAVEVLEAIKLFLDVEGCVYVLGLDQAVIARGIEIKYKELGYYPVSEDERQMFVVDGSHYLEKIIQLPFHLPLIERSNMQSFVTRLVVGWLHEECPKIFAEGLSSNPRQIKRTVNVFLFLVKLAEKRRQKIYPVRLAKIVAIQSVFPELYNFLKEEKYDYLQKLETYFLDKLENLDDRYWREFDEYYDEENDQPFDYVSNTLGKFLKSNKILPIQRILTLHPNNPEYNFNSIGIEEISDYFSLTRRMEGPKVDTEEKLVNSIVEPEMVCIPAGIFKMGMEDEYAQKLRKEGNKNKEVKWEIPIHPIDVPKFWIGKNPITNAEYRTFIVDTHHDPPPHWEGEQYPIGRGSHPVVNVSWKDANSYCQWLSRKTGIPYHLPGESQWEKAARGGLFIPKYNSNDNEALENNLHPTRNYPWGDDWQLNSCNSFEENHNDTKPVGSYSPRGDSPYGCSDMAGNIWEWCNNRFNEYQYLIEMGKLDLTKRSADLIDHFVIRGGSYSDNKWMVRITTRKSSHISDKKQNIGFRICAALSPYSADIEE